MLNKIHTVRLVEAIKTFSMVNTVGIITFIMHIVGRKFGKRTGDRKLYRPRNTS